MSFQITTNFVDQFSRTLRMLSQQKGSRLRNAVDVETIRGEQAFFEQIGAVTAQQRTTRFGDSPQFDTPHYRRRLTPTDWEWGDFIDHQDQVRMLIDPSSKYVQSAVYALGRVLDDLIIEAATGTAYTGKTGSTATALPASQKLNVNVGGGGSSTGLNIEKLIATKKIFMENDVDYDDPMNKLCFVVSAQQMDDLLNEEKVTNSDYATIKALVKGEINSYMGFEFIRTERLSLNTSSDVRTCFAFAKSGIKLGINSDITTRISERSDKGFSWYAYARLTAGSTRMEEEKVVEVPCDESP